MAMGEQMRPELNVSGEDVRKAFEGILDAFAQHPELSKALGSPALVFLRNEAEDLVSNQLEAFMDLAPNRGSLRDDCHKCIEITKRAHELCTFFLDYDVTMRRWPLLFTPNPEKGWEVLALQCALMSANKSLSETAHKSSDLYNSVKMAGDIRMEWIKQRNSDQEQLSDFIERIVPIAANNEGIKLGLRLIEAKLIEASFGIKWWHAVVNLSLILRNLFYQGVIRGQGGNFDRQQRREGALEVGIETFQSAIGAVPIIGHFYDAFRVLTRWGDVFRNREIRLKRREDIDDVQAYVDAYDRAILIWAQIASVLRDLIITQSKELEELRTLYVKDGLL